MEITTIKMPSVEGIDEARVRCVEDVDKFSIIINSEYQEASKYLRMIAGYKKLVEETFAESKNLAHRTHKAITMAENKAMQPFLDAELILKKKLLIFKEEEERKNREEQKRLQEEAELKARIEAQRKAEEDRLIEAQSLKDIGEHETAEEILNSDFTAEEINEYIQPAKYIPPPIEIKVGGVHTRDNWKYQIIEPLNVPREFLCVDEIKLGKYARMMKADARMDGVRFYNDKTIVGKSF